MNKYRNWVTPAVEQDVLDLVRAGWSTRGVASVVDRSHTTVRLVAKRHGLHCVGKPGPDNLCRRDW